MHLLKTLFSGAALACVVAAATPANATLMITANGTLKATDTTNTFTSFNGMVGAFNINQTNAAGVNAFGGSGQVLDVGSLNISTSGSGTLTLLVTETDLTAPAVATLYGDFTALLSNATATRAYYLDQTNSGLMTTLLGSTSSASGSFALTTALSGPFSITEKIVITALGAGATLSSDDRVSVPEPMSLLAFGSGLLGLGMVRRRNRTTTRALAAA